MLPRNQRARTALSTAEAQASEQNDGIPEFRVNRPLVKSYDKNLTALYTKIRGQGKDHIKER